MSCKTWWGLVLVLFVVFTGCSSSKFGMTPASEWKKNPLQNRSDSFLSQLLSRYPQYFDTLLRNRETYPLQIIYTRIDRTRRNRPRFTHHYFDVEPSRYFYPASTVKMPVALLALEKLHELGREGLDRNTTMITEAAYAKQTPVYNDPVNEDGRPTIANYIKKIFLVSDNDAFNRLYEFLGQAYINNRLHEKGYETAQILQRLSIPLTEDQNRHTNPVRFYDTASRLIYEKPLQKSEFLYQPRKTLLGQGYYAEGKLKHEPFDFSKRNRLSLVDLHSILMSVSFPRSVPKKSRFKLNNEEYRFLYRYMSMKPRESDFPQYDSSYTDAYVKFLLYGGKGAISDTAIRIFNKVGDAYGFLTDAAYVVDFKNNIEFVLSATIYCNADGIFNDDTYDYDTVGYPFLKNLGQVIYQYELQRTRERRPDLSAFKIDYVK